MATYLLLDETSVARLGKPLFYHQWTAIGPATTAQIVEAERFPSELKANSSIAHSHPLLRLKPVTLAEAKKMVKAVNA